METLLETRSFCPSCASTEYVVKLKLPFSDPKIRDFIKSYYGDTVPLESLDEGSFEIARCKCGFIWQTNILNPTGMQRFYGQWIDSAKSLEKREKADLSYYMGLAKNLAFCKAALGKTEVRAKSLDYGMGWGHWAIMALAFGFDSYGTELSPDRIEFAKQRGVKVIDDLEAMEPESFRVINADQVMEHIPDPNRAFGQLSRLLTKGGIMHVAVPDGTKDAASLDDGSWKPKKSATQLLEHINAFTPQTLMAMAQRNGLTLLKTLPLIGLGSKMHKIIKLDFLPTSLYLKITNTRLYFTK